MPLLAPCQGHHCWRRLLPSSFVIAVVVVVGLRSSSTYYSAAAAVAAGTDDDDKAILRLRQCCDGHAVMLRRRHCHPLCQFLLALLPLGHRGLSGDHLRIEL